jgi:hypothetical protein
VVVSIAGALRDFEGATRRAIAALLLRNNATRWDRISRSLARAGVIFVDLRRADAHTAATTSRDPEPVAALVAWGARHLPRASRSPSPPWVQ